MEIYIRVRKQKELKQRGVLKSEWKILKKMLKWIWAGKIAMFEQRGKMVIILGKDYISKLLPALCDE